MKIYLIGMPGSGKTTLGKQIAEDLGFPFIDLDTEIENREGKSISEIFSHKGEDHFRVLESTLLKELSSSSHNVVIATGGGAPCYFGGMETMNATGLTVFIDVPLDDI